MVTKNFGFQTWGIEAVNIVAYPAFRGGNNKRQPSHRDGADGGRRTKKVANWTVRSSFATEPQRRSRLMNGQAAKAVPYGQAATAAPYGQTATAAPYGQAATAAPYGQAATAAPYGQYIS
jgi:hypothetical protein